jgi:hypothetical protein
MLSCMLSSVLSTVSSGACMRRSDLRAVHVRCWAMELDKWSGELRELGLTMNS